MRIAFARWATTLCLLCSAMPAAAQDEDSKHRLSIHGYLTQGYGRSDGHQVLGINEDGTSDYRTAALQVRYDSDERNAFVLQLSHERTGESPISVLREDVELDWVFYQHQFAGGTRVRVGRVPMPGGIYNEIRDVGTLLPLFRPPNVRYNDAIFSNETIDGLSLSHHFAMGGEWSLNVEPFAGQWDYFNEDFAVETAKDAFGAQLWVNTPVPGLRVGGGWTQYDAFAKGVETETIESWHASLDGRFSRFLLQAEYLDVPFEGGFYRSRYGLAGVQATEKVWLYAQYSDSDLAFTIPFLGRVDVDYLERDLALAVGYRARADLVLKLEGHRVKTFEPEDVPDAIFSPEPFEADYGLISLSTSF